MMQDFAHQILLTHSFLCAFLTGLIMVVQWVHYPSFHYIDKIQSQQFHSFHQKSITWIVMPTMLLELVSGALLLIIFWKHASFSLVLMNFLALIAIWINTALFAMPIHQALIQDQSKNQTAAGASIQKLLQVNLWRVLFWTTRSLLLFILLMK
jgi:hypothetical protein